MASSTINKLFTIIIIPSSLLTLTAHSYPITSEAVNYRLHKRDILCNKCPGSPETVCSVITIATALIILHLIQKTSLLEQFKKFEPTVTIETVVIRSGYFRALSVTEEDEVKFIIPNEDNHYYGNIVCDYSSK